MAGRSITLARLAARAAWAPVVIVAFVALQLIIRLLLSPNLEIDEAQFVGEVDLRLIYSNSHPPLYNWMIRGALELFGWNWVAAVSIPKFIMIAGLYLLVWDAARRAFRDRPEAYIVAACTAAALTLMPQIAWQAPITLAHSVMVTFAAAGVLHAAVCIARRPSWLNFAWLGVAFSVGALSKYNIFLSTAALLIAAYSLPAVRPQLFNRRLFLSAAIFAALFSVQAWATYSYFLGSSARIQKLYDTGNKFLRAIDIPWIGVDGTLGLVLAAAASTAPLLIFWLITWARDGSISDPAPAAAPASDDFSDTIGRLCGRALAIALIGTGVVAFFGDLHQIHERYLMPLLMPLPIWLAWRFPVARRPRLAAQFLALALVIASLITVARPVAALVQGHILTFPFAPMAADIRATLGPIPPEDPLPIATHRHDMTGNFVIRIPHTTPWIAPQQPPRVLVVWRADEEKPEKNRVIAQLGPGYFPVSPVYTSTHDTLGPITEPRTLEYQLFEYRPQAAPAKRDTPPTDPSLQPR